MYKALAGFLLLLTSLSHATVLLKSEAPVEDATQDYFRPDLTGEELLRNRAIAFEFLLVNGKKETPILIEKMKISVDQKRYEVMADGKVFSPESCTDKFRGSFFLEHDKFHVENSRSQKYEVLFQGDCGKKYTFKFNKDSFGGQAVQIFELAKKAWLKMQDTGVAKDWKRKVPFVYPASGDYYNYRKVHITKGYQWDVVGHELGHAIYDQGRIGHFGGGPHRIDECYSKNLALSEGWASYFSAWVSVKRDDPDAKFEYMVPRRAPLEIEHVPADVCKGQTNEWRVYAFLWDLIDLNDDGETHEVNFKRLWDVTLNQNFRSAEALKKGILSSGFDENLVNAAWNLSILGL